VRRRWILWLLLGLATPALPAAAPVILVYGDSISAGYGLSRLDEGWVALLRTRLQKKGYGYEVVNASITGETTAGGLARLPRALAAHHPAVVLLELGGNDGLRALPLEQMQENLERMIELARQSGARVVLLGMRIPPNYGPRYTDRFHATFAALAARDHVAFVPFLLERVALDPERMQADGVHPNAAAQPELLDTLWPVLEPLLRH